MKDRDCFRRLHACFWFIVPLVAVLALLALIIKDNSFAAVSRRMPAEAPGTGYRPGSVPVIEQEFDLIAVRGDEPVDIVISPDGRRAYVPGRNTDTLFVIDLATDQIVEVIDLYPEAHHPLGPAPEQLAITPDGGRVLVTNANDDSLTVVDTAADTVIKTLPVGRMPVDVAISPDGSLAYVLNKGDQTITVLDPAATKVLTTVNVPGGGGPFAVTFAPDGDRAYVAIHNGPVYIVNPATHAVVGSITVPNAGWTGDLAISADGNTGYLNTLEGDAVIVLDLVNGQTTGTFTVTNPIGLALNADGSRLYVGTFGFSGESAYNLWMFDTASSEVVTGVNFIHPAPYGRASSDIEGLALTPAGSTLYAASVDADGVFVVDAETLKPTGMIPTQAIASFLPLRAAIGPDGAYLYVAGGTQRPTTVSVIDTRTLQVVGEIVAQQDGPCAGNSSGLALSPDGSTLYVLSSDGNCVLVADTQSRSVVGHFNVGTSGLTLTHIAVHPDGDKAYVLDYGGNVYVVDLQDYSVLGTMTTNVEQAWTLKLRPDRTRAYVTGVHGFAVLDLTTNTVLKMVNFGSGGEFSHVHGRAVGVKPDSSQYLVGEFFNMRVYNAASDEEIRNVDLTGWNPYRTLVRDIVFSPDGHTGYLAMWDEKAVIAFDADTWEVGARIDVGRAPYFGVCPTWLVLSPDGSRLYAVNEESDNVVVIDTATHAVVKAIRVGKPYRIYLPAVLKNATPPSIVVGTVTGMGGTPIAGIVVGAGDYNGIVNCGQGEFRTSTAEDGSYRLQVTPGTYLVFINSNHQPGSHVPEAYPNVNSWASIGAAARVVVAVGQSVTGVDFSLPLGFTVSGRLVDHQGHAVPGAGGNIHDFGQGIEFGCALGFGSSDVDGRFQVHVPAGTYDLYFGTDSEGHVVRRNLAVSNHTDLGDVLFTEAP